MDTHRAAHASSATMSSRPLGAVLFLLAVVALFAVAGCGVSNSNGSAAGPSGTPASTAQTSGTPASSPAAGASTTPVSGMPATHLACPGGTGSASDAGIPALILGSGASQQRQGAAPGGALVQIRLAAQQRWRLVGVHGTTANAQMLSPAGYLDPTLGDCIWNLRLPPTPGGTVTVTFTATALCAAHGPCPQYVLLATFTIDVR